MSWILKKSGHKPTGAPLSRSALNASSEVLHLISVTPWHQTTSPAHTWYTCMQAKKETGQRQPDVCLSRPIRTSWVYRRWGLKETGAKKAFQTEARLCWDWKWCVFWVLKHVNVFEWYPQNEIINVKISMTFLSFIQKCSESKSKQIGQLLWTQIYLFP